MHSALPLEPDPPPKPGTWKKDVSFLLLSGGTGSRAGHHEPKQFRRIAGIEMMAWSLRLAGAHPRIAEIITNAPAGYHDRTQKLCAAHAPLVPAQVLDCGATRQESVRILAAAARHDIVILHEAARPMIDHSMVDELLAAEAENAGLFASIPFSMCEIDQATGLVARDVPRARVANIQLPQKFDRATLVAAHSAAARTGLAFTEDAVLVHQLAGACVRALPGYVRNIKVTTPEDFGIVAGFMEKRQDT